MTSASSVPALKPNAQGRPSQFSKTKLCRFQLLGICAKGLQCPFAHGEDELKPLPDLRCTKLCRQLLTEGQCTTPNCGYAHRREELRSAAPSKADGRQKLKRGKANQKEAAPSSKEDRLLMPPPGLEEWSGTTYDAFASVRPAQATAVMPGVDPKDMYFFPESYRMPMQSTLPDVADLHLGLPVSSDETGEAADVPAYVHVPLQLGEIDPGLLKGTLAADGSSTTDVSETSTVEEDPITEEPWMESYAYTWYGNAGGSELSGYGNFGNENMRPRAVEIGEVSASQLRLSTGSWSTWNERDVVSDLILVEVLDFLMDVKDGQLAEALSRELKFFVNIAKKTKEKERRKRRPTSVFSNKAAPEDIESILSITLELLDKWGRYYEAAGSPGGAKIVDAWKELTKENVRFPQGPAEYVFLTKPSASRDAGAFGFGSTGGGGGSSSFGGFGVEVSAPGSNSELSEPALQSLAAAVQSAVAQYGPGSPEAGEATAHFESMLAQWQHAAAEAVERGDMAAYEHFSAVAVRYAELQIGSPSASTENSRTFSGVSGVSPSPPDSDTVPESHSSSHKKHRRRKKEPQPDTFEVPPEVAMTPSFGHPGSDWAEADAAAAAYRAGEFGGSFGVGSSGFASDPGDSSDPFGAPSGAQGQGMSTEDFGGLAGGLSGSFPDAGMAQFGSQPGAYGAAGYDYGFNTGAFDAPGSQATQPSMDYDQQFARGTDPNSFSGSASAMMAMAHGSGGAENFNKASAPAPDAGPADLGPEEVDSEAAEAEEGGSRLRQLCERLQAEVEELKGQLQSSNSKELKAAQKRIKELERQQQRQEGQDSRDLTISALRETNMQMQAELDRRGLDLAAARRKAVEVEKRLSEKEEVFSDTCQRLVEAQQRVAQLEGELTHQREVETSLQDRLQGARAQQTVAEVELRQARHALSSATGLESDLQRRSVPYGSGSFAPRPSADLQAPDLNLSVSQADELASTVSAEKAPQSRFISADPESTREMPKAAPLPRSSPQTWMETPRIWQPVGALVRRLPPSHELTLRTSSHFRDLLLKQQGILYEDQQVLLALRSRVAPSTSTSSRRTIEFEATLSNRSGHQIHDVKLQPAADAHSVASRFDLQLQVRGRESAGHSSSMLWPQHQLHFDGKLEVFGVVDSSDGGPQVDLSYLLPDNQAL
ncbi:unnamed protein product, partial [Symbiodinium microadriaticum]